MGLFSKNKQISVSVFCGAEEGNKKYYAQMANNLGKLLAKNKMRLVYGAGGKGLMGCVARGVLDNGGKIFGVTTKIIAAFEKPIKGTKTKYTPNIQKRKRTFIDNSDAFIVLPGGFGTFDELFDLLTGKEIINKYNEEVASKKINETRPIIIVNYKGYFKQFDVLMNFLIKEGFMKKDNKKIYQMVSTPEEAVKLIKKTVKK